MGRGSIERRESYEVESVSPDDDGRGGGYRQQYADGFRDTRSADRGQDPSYGGRQGADVRRHPAGHSGG